LNPIERIKAEKLGLELMHELPRLAAMQASELSEDDKQRIKWIGFWYRKDGTLMQRIRIPGGTASSEQLRVIAGIAKDFGHDLVDVTTRAQIQLRYIQMSQIPEIFERLRAVGLSSIQTGMDSIRNVVTSSIAGICAREIFDALPVVREVSDWVTNGLEGNPATSNLPRKMNFHITGHPDDVGAATNDIGMYPARKIDHDGTQQLGFNVMVGGAVGGKFPKLASEIDVFVTIPQALEVVRGIVELFNLHGPREERHKSRLKWLIELWGFEKFRHELEAHLGHTLERAGEDLRTTGDPHSSLGIHAQKQPGLVYVAAHVAVGRTTGTALEQLADLADTFGNGEARFTIEQNILLPNIEESRVDQLLEHPFFLAHSPFPSKVAEGVVSCTGVEFCPFALIETKSRALEVTHALEAQLEMLPLAKPLRIHWSGCQHACSSHHIGDFGLQGTKVKVDGVMVDAVDVYVGGKVGRDARLADKIADRIPIADLPAKLIELTKKHLPSHLGTNSSQQVLAAADD
jgi:ferredoxin-nitrite reductase